MALKWFKLSKFYVMIKIIAQKLHERIRKKQKKILMRFRGIKVISRCRLLLRRQCIHRDCREKVSFLPVSKECLDNIRLGRSTRALNFISQVLKDKQEKKC